MSDKHPLGFATRALHAGYDPAQHNQSRQTPLYQTTAYCFEDADHAAQLFKLQQSGYIYSRINNPTLDVLEQRISALENGSMAVAFASGMAAVSSAILTILHAGDEIVSSASLYGGTYNLFATTLPRYGITTHFAKAADTESFREAITPKTKALYCETIGNPAIDIPDLAALAELAHEHEIPLFVDNTTATPYLCRPIEHGADVVIHSASKFIGGHGGSMGGLVTAGGNFNWVKSFPFLEDYQDFESPYIMALRLDILRDLGGAMAPFNAYLMIQGLETLALRMKQHCQNTEIVARWLAEREEVDYVNYPIFEDHPTRKNAKRYLPQGCSALLSFGLKGGYDAGKNLVNRVKMIHHLANLGDTKSLILHPASTSHELLTPEQRLAAGVPDELIRLSVGIEDVQDILNDLEQGLHRD